MELDQLTRAFRGKREDYEAFTPSIESLLKNLISTTGVEPFAYESRTKTLASFDEKIQREDKEGKYSALDDMTDLSGVRIICYLQEDCDAVCKLIEDEFEVDSTNSVTKQEELDPDKFGYLSTHYVVSLDEKRESLKEFRSFAKLKAEVQVRTLLQHTWAAIDWKFRYKEEREAPKPLRRRLFRISALLEAADNEFSQVKVELDQLRKSYSESLASGRLDIAVNTESVATYFRESETSKAIIASAKQAGLRVLPTVVQGGGVLRLVSTAESLGYKTIAELDAALKRLEPEAKKFYSFLIEHVQPARGGKPVQLIMPAILRYLLLAFAPSGKRQLINKQHQPPPGFGEAMAAFDRNRKGVE
jgi:ppGpp synthetase/RelA/SpoT-type nucleotidyltranferase